MERVNYYLFSGYLYQDDMPRFLHFVKDNNTLTAEST